MKNYYLILGINETADLKKIKKAYRDIAKVSHPDVAENNNSSDRFKEVKEAYDTLSDVEKRRVYDINLKRERNLGPRPEKINSRVSNGNETGFMEPSGFFSNADEIIKDFFSNHLPNAYMRESDIQFEVILTPDEAMAGVLCPIHVPVIIPCRRCLGSSLFLFPFCPYCNGTGQILSKKTLTLNIPKGVTNGVRYTISLDDAGLENIYVSVRVIVQ